MDQTVNLKHQKLSLSEETKPDSYSDILYYQEPNVDLANQRGDLIVNIELHSISQQPIDLPKLAQELFEELRKNYYQDDKHGSPIEALESALELARQKHQTLTSKTIQLKIAAVCIWGKTIVYANPDNCFIGIRRNQELNELDQMPYGTEELKHDDLLMTGSTAMGTFIFKPKLRELQNLTNRAFIEELQQTPNTQESEHTGPQIGYVVLVDIDRVPGKEEIIEIHLPTHEEKSIRKPFMDRFKKLFARKPKTNKRKKFEDPAIYLKPAVKHKGRRFMFLLLIVGLLGGSIFFTHRYNQKKSEDKRVQAILQTAQTQLDRAEQLSKLNPRESEQLLQQTQETLGQVQGARTDIAQQTTELESRSNEIRLSIYKTQTVTPTEGIPPTDVLERVHHIQGTTVTNSVGTVEITDSGTWKNARSVDAYDGNLYVLDIGSNGLWKYSPVGSNYRLIKNYFSDSIGLSQALDVSIDGSVYILFTDHVEKYTVGKRDDFRLSGIHPDFSPNSAIAVEPEGSHIIVSTDTTLLVFGSDGSYQKQLAPENFPTITEVVSADKGKVAWVFAGDRWWQFTL